MKPMKLISGLLALLVCAPIWYYLLYQILMAVGATELMWFLYWIYIPVAIFSGILNKIAAAVDDQEE